MSSGEREDTRLDRLVRELILVVKGRIMLAVRLSPETLNEEFWTLGALYTIRENLRER